MITAIELENFKAFGERQRLEIRPITLLYGKNSSGKSSCIRALQMLRQTARGARSLREVVLSGPRADVDLGSFYELVHGHDVTRTCAMSLELSHEHGSPTRVDATIAASSIDAQPRIHSMRFSLRTLNQGWHTHADLTPDPDDPDSGDVTRPSVLGREAGGGPRQFSLMPADLDARLLTELAAQAETDALDLFSAIVSGSDTAPHPDYPPHLGWRVWRGALLTGPFEYPLKEADQIRDEFVQRWRAATTSDAISSFWHNCMPAELVAIQGSLIGGAHSGTRPLDWDSVFAADTSASVAPAPPSRSYSRSRRARLLSGMLNYALDRFCTNPAVMLSTLADDITNLRAIAALREPPARLLAYEDDHARVEEDCLQVSRHLPAFGIARELKVNRLRTADHFRNVGYELRLVPVGGDALKGESWADVGVGVSQVVPVIRECVRSSGLVCVEQPELHLHPAAQSNLADFFVELATSTPPSGGRKPAFRGPIRAVSRVQRRILAETHSEHLVLRLRQLVRQGAIAPDSVSLNVIETEDGEARIRRVDLDERGRFLDPWPGGFFPERDALL